MKNAIKKRNFQIFEELKTLEILERVKVFKLKCLVIKEKAS